MMKRQFAYLAVAIAVLLGGSLAAAAEPAWATIGGGANRSDLAEVTQVPQRVVAAWMRNDADSFAKVFTGDAEFVVGDGTYLNGRPEIRQYMVDAFSGPLRGTRVTATVFNVRFLDHRVAVVHHHGGILFPGEVDVPPERRGVQVWIVVKDHGQWNVAAYQNTRISASE